MTNPGPVQVWDLPRLSVMEAGMNPLRDPRNPEHGAPRLGLGVGCKFQPSTSAAGRRILNQLLDVGSWLSTSVDQQGNIQPIGGANEKIEGFYLTCKHKGLTGEQGVILPEQNVVNVMLRDEVRQAVAEGQFHIYPVRTIDEGIEILTGVPAGKLQDDGTYPEDSVHYRVLTRLEEIAANLKEQKKDDADDEDGNPDEEGNEKESAQGDQDEPAEP